MDFELLSEFQPGTTLSATLLKTPRSPALAAWWQLMGAAASHSTFVTGRALSNAILISFDLVDQELLMNDGVRNIPMSLRDFTEEQRWNLVEKARLVIHREIIPGVDIDRLIEESRVRRNRS